MLRIIYQARWVYAIITGSPAAIGWRRVAQTLVLLVVMMTAGGVIGYMLLLMLVLMLLMSHSCSRMMVCTIVVQWLVDWIVWITQNRIDGIHFAQLLKQRYQVEQFRVAGIVKPWLYRHLKKLTVVDHLISDGELNFCVNIGYKLSDKDLHFKIFDMKHGQTSKSRKKNNSKNGPKKVRKTNNLLVRTKNITIFTFIT